MIDKKFQEEGKPKVDEERINLINFGKPTPKRSDSIRFLV
jgi:hypothetical protein